MKFLMNQNLVAWSCRGMCGTKLKYRHALVLCPCCGVVSHMCEPSLLRPVHTYTTRHDTTACDTTRFFAPHTIKWISSHICSTTKSGRHDKKLLNQNCSGSDAIFVVCCIDSTKKTAKENSFHRNLTWVYKFMMQE